MEFDTLLAGYLWTPPRPPTRSSALRGYLGLDVLAESSEPGDRRSCSRRPVADGGRRAAAVALLAPVMQERIESGPPDLLADVELPLSACSRRCRRAGSAGRRLSREMADELGDRIATLEAEIFACRASSSTWARRSSCPCPVRAARAAARKRTPKGRPSTDADVLEKLRDRHPIVDALLDHRELTKLKSTYLDALPPLVGLRDGRIHTTYNQTGAATGRLSAANPNLQNIPVRGESGRRSARRSSRAADRCCWWPTTRRSSFA